MGFAVEFEGGEWGGGGGAVKFREVWIWGAVEFERGGVSGWSFNI